MDILDTKQVAEYLNIKKTTLAKWRSEGLPPKFSKINGKVFYDKKDIDNLINENKFTITDECRKLKTKQKP